MTSENSFLVNLKNNNKRRIWVWVLCIFSMLAVYPGILTVYFARIESYMANGYYQNNSQFKEALGQSVLDSAASYPILLSGALALVIAIQGYSYLFSRRKVDMYLSVPVSMRSRFFTIYLNGIFIYMSSLLLGVAGSLIMAIAKGATFDALYTRFFMLVALAILLFFIVYNITVLAVMLTGNLFMALSLAVVLIFYVGCWTSLIMDYKNSYWQTYISVFNERKGGIAISDIIGYPISYLNNSSYGWADYSRPMLFALIGSLIWIVLSFALAYINYLKRPAEAAGKSVVFYSNKIFIKLMIMVPSSLFFASWMKNISEDNKTLVMTALILSAIIIGMLLEIAFNMEFKSAFKHWGSVFVGLVLAFFVFAVFRYDLFKYDQYVPKQDEIDSYVVMNQYESYTEVIDFKSFGDNHSYAYMDPALYAKENMMLNDSEAIVALAKKSIMTEKDNMKSPLPLLVYYRLKSGRNVSRAVWVDLGDETNDVYLNRIIGPAYYKEGIWQAMSMDIPEDLKVTGIVYSNALIDEQLKITDADKIIKLWRDDMSAYDYDRVRYDNEKGYISITMDNWTSWTLPVYSCFDKLNNYLAKEYDFVDDEIPLEAIKQIKITKYDYETVYDGKIGDAAVEGSVNEVVYDDMETIKTIYDAIYLRPMHSDWHPYDEVADSYGIEIDLTQDYINIYNSVSLYSFSFKSESVGKLVEDGLIP